MIQAKFDAAWNMKICVGGFCNDAATFKFVLLPSVADHCGDDRNLLTDIQSINIHLLIKFAHASFFLTSFFHSFIYFLSYYSF